MKDNRRASAEDPFASPSLRGPGLWRSLRESFGGLRRLLDVAQIEITSVCPGRCAYCPHTTMRDVWEARHMTPEVFVSLWPLLLECGRVHLQGWGEPLLHPRFLDMVALARRADCRVSTTTCGLIMNEALAEGIVASGLDIVAFSLTGASPESHAKMRANVDRARLMESIRLLQRVRKEKLGVHLEVHLAYMMMASAIHEVAALPDLMEELGIHAAVVSTLDYLPSPEWAPEAFLPQEGEKIAEARAALEEAAARASALGRAIYYSLPVPEPRGSCLEHPERSVFIDALGQLSPCIYTNLPARREDPLRRVFGRSTEQDPLLIRKGERFAAFVDALASGEPEAPCLRCPKRFAAGNRK